MANLFAGQPRQYWGFLFATWMMLGSHRSSMYGPVPAVWSRSQFSALSPPLSLPRTAVGLTISRKRRPGEEGVVGLVQVEHDRRRLRRLHLDDRLDVERGGLLEGLGPLHRELDRGRVERGPVAELHPAAQLERPGLAVGRHLPRGRQHRAEPVDVVVQVDERLVEVVEGPPQAVEPARVRIVGAERAELADVQRVVLGRRRCREDGGDDGDGEQREQPESHDSSSWVRGGGSGGHQGDAGHQRNAGMISRPYVSRVEKCSSGSTIDR